MNIRTTKTGIAAVLAVGIVAGLLIGRTIPDSRANSRDDANTTQDLPSDIFAIRKMAAARDVKGLTSILSNGRLESRLVAANFLAKMAPLPALETVSMHAVGELRADRQGGRLRLYSTGCADWLELADSTIIVHTGSSQAQAGLVRLTHDKEGEERQRADRQRESANVRRECEELEKRLASATTVPSDVNQLRERLENYSKFLDLMDQAIYITPANGGLHLEDRVYHREAGLFPSDDGVRAEWHGNIVEADGITLLLGLAPVRTEGPAAPSDNWRSRFDSVYSLADGEILRWVRTPFIPERRYYTQELHYYSGTDNPPPPLYLSFRWDGTLHQWRLAMHECGLGSLLWEFGLKRYEWSLPAELFQLRLGGDWIVRTDTSLEQRFNALEGIVERELGRRLHFLRENPEREVVVVRGRYERRVLEGHTATEPVYLFAGATPDEGRLRWEENVAKMLDRVAEHFNRPFILEIQGLDEVSVTCQECLSYATFLARQLDPEDPFPMNGTEDFDSVLTNLARQTSLEFSRETRPFATWFVTEIRAPNGMSTGDPPAR